MKNMYLLVDFFTILFPFIFSFEKKIAFCKQWKYLFPAFSITAIVFLVWDYLYTNWGVWGFNNDYLLGPTIVGLPFEEILFFFCIPFACFFIYEFVNTYFPHTSFLDKHANQISILLLLICLTIGAFNYTKAYTVLNASFAVILLSVQIFIIKGSYMGRFYRFYLIHLIPFFIVNSMLTGTGISNEVVWYNNHENLGIRLGTIPIEDTIYTLSLMLMNVSIFEYLRRKKSVINAYTN